MFRLRFRSHCYATIDLILNTVTKTTLTPQGRVSRKKRTVAQPVKKFTAYYETRRFITVPYLTTANMEPLPVHNLSFYLFYILFNIILQFMLRAPE